MSTLLNFDWNETLKVANIVGFHPETNEEHQIMINEVRSTYALSADNEEQADKAYFYVTLGGFIDSEYTEKGKEVPEEIYDFHALNNALTWGDGKYREVLIHTGKDEDDHSEDINDECLVLMSEIEERIVTLLNGIWFSKPILKELLSDIVERTEVTKP